MTLFTIKVDRLPQESMDASSLFGRSLHPRKVFRSALRNKIEYYIHNAKEKGKQYGYFKSLDILTDGTKSLYEIEKELEREIASLERHKDLLVTNSKEQTQVQGLRYYEDAINALHVVKDLVQESKRSEFNFYHDTQKYSYI